MSKKLQLQVEGRERKGSEPGGESVTHQSFKDEADITRILGNYRQHGFIDPVHLRNPVYGDFDSVQDFHDQQTAIANAWSIFEHLPARVRALCDNDAAKLMDQVSTPEGRDEMRRAGWKGEWFGDDEFPPGFDQITGRFIEQERLEGWDDFETEVTDPVTTEPETPPEGGENPPE